MEQNKSLPKVMCEAGFCMSFAEARRLIFGHRVFINGERATISDELKEGDTVWVQNKGEVKV